MKDNGSNIKRTLKEKKFIEAYIKHEGNLTKAYLEISPGCSIPSARVLGYRWLQKVNIPAKELLDRLDLNDFALSQKLKEGLEAIKKVAGVDVPDHNIRVRYLDMAFKLKNTYPGEKGKPEEPPEDTIIKVTYPEEENGKNITDRLFSEISKLVEKRIETKDKYRDKYKEIDDNGVDHRSEMQKLADRLIALGKGD
ncbi:hypothetical protein ES705_44582 [subsurface metagenome]